MIRFNNDYNIGMHPAILEALKEDAGNSYPGYMLDPWCEKAAKEIKKYLRCPDAEIHFAIGGTQANYIIIDAALRSVESVICADTGHINVHEAGAVENTGHKIEALPSTDGKITAAQIEAHVKAARESEVAEHITQPGLVYLSFPTEFGTLYSKEELKAIRKVCTKYELFLFVDGARMGYGLGSSENNVQLSDLARYTDIFYIGGTKCGAMFGEAIVICNPVLQPMFRNFLKQDGAILAKGWLLGIQFFELFKAGLYFDITKKADEFAMDIKHAFKDAGIKSYIESPTNQQFVVLTKEQAAALSRDFIYENEGTTEDGKLIVRFCTSWATTQEEVDALRRRIMTL